MDKTALVFSFSSSASAVAFRQFLGDRVQLPTEYSVPKPVAEPNSGHLCNAALGMGEDQTVDFPTSRMFLAEGEEPPGQVGDGGWTRHDGQLRLILPLDFDSSPGCLVFFGIWSAFMTEWRQNSVLI